MVSSVIRWLDCLFNIWPFSTMIICSIGFKICQSKLKMKRNSKSAQNSKWPKFFNVVPEWRNFAKYGHTIGRRKRIHCAIKASLFNNNLTPACQRVRYVNIAIDIGRCKAVTTSSTFQLPSTVSFRKLHLVPENFESFNYVVLESLKVLFNSRLFSKTLKFYLVPEILNVLFSSWKLENYI